MQKQKSTLLAQESAAWNSNASVLNLVEIAKTLVIHPEVSKPISIYIYIYISYTILYYIILYYTILYYIILYYIILYYTMLYYIILYYIILYYIILYYIILYMSIQIHNYVYTECHLCLSTMQSTALVSCRTESKSLDHWIIRRSVPEACVSWCGPWPWVKCKAKKFPRRYTVNHRTGVSWCRGGCSPDGLRAEIRILDAQSSVRRKLKEVQSEYGGP